MFKQNFGHLVSDPIVAVRMSALCVATVLGCISLSTAAQPQEAMTPQSPMTLSQAISQVRQYQLSQGAWQTQQLISEAAIQHSGLWQNPNFSIEQTGFDQNHDRELAIAISQRLDIFGERQARQNLAKLAQTQMNWRKTIYQAQLELVVKYLWSQVKIAAIEAQLRREQLHISQQTLQVAEKRYRAGAIAQVDVDRVRMTVLEDQRALQQADIQLQAAEQRLAQSWGGHRVSLADDVDINALFPEWSIEKLEQLQHNNLREQGLHLEAQQTYAEMAYLKAKNRPNPTVSMGMTRNQSPEQQSNTQLSVGLEIPLNLFDRQQYQNRMVQARQRGLAEQQKFYQQQNQLEIADLTRRLQNLKAQYRHINQTQVPLAQQVQQKTSLGFEAGKLSVTDIQQAALQLQDIRLRKVQILRDAWADVIEAESLSLGISPDRIMAVNALAQMNEELWQDTRNWAVIGE